MDRVPRQATGKEEARGVPALIRHFEGLTNGCDPHVLPDAVWHCIAAPATAPYELHFEKLTEEPFEPISEEGAEEADHFELHFEQLDEESFEPISEEAAEEAQPPDAPLCIWHHASTKEALWPAPGQREPGSSKGCR